MTRSFMQKIKILPPATALKIAAGEVIERPAHVVKELVENSLDAGATSISVFIKKAGKELIRIVDNGCGMSKADAELCFLPHATSKIATLDDLETVASFGFRGEALASIAAISKVVLLTKQQSTSDNALGLRISWSDSVLQECQEVACASGVDIQIHDLFFNTPVRKKFLKADETELNAIKTIIQAYALANQNILFKLFFDDVCVLHAPPVTSLKDRIAQVWDLVLAQSMRPLIAQEQNSPVTISGVISHPHLLRYNRANIAFFVNKRWVKNNELSKALMKGYLNVLPPNKFPAAVIFIDVDPRLVDVNIHPKKEEVKFAQPSSVYTPLATLVKNSLEDGVTASVTQSIAKTVERPFSLTPTAHHAEEFLSSQAKTWDPLPFVQKSTSLSTNTLPPLDRPLFTLPTTIVKQTPIQAPESQPLTLGRIIGQVLATYILVEGESELVVIDQHAAHERVLYEQLAKQFEPGQGTALLFPEVIELTQQQTSLILKHQEFFGSQGIALERWSDTSIVVRTTPPAVRGQSIKELVHDVVEFIEEHDALDWSLWNNKLLEHMHGQMACKGAVKAGDILPIEQMKQLLKDLVTCNNRFICVHGRPTMWKISQNELEKQFRRVG